MMPGAASVPVANPQWIVVLGAAQYNGQPSAILRGRLEAAFALYQQGKAPRIVVTGGRRPGDTYSEGQVGCSYLRKRGIPPRALRCEDKSRRTIENLENIKPIIGKDAIIVVTDEPHLPRALILADQLGIAAIGHGVKGNFKESYRQREEWLALLARLGFK
jgi:uncharacterized SAM-binding protein YcdF (DUF218 family)